MGGADRVRFDQLQFELQLDLEDLTEDQLREHGTTFRARADHLFGPGQETRFDIALRVLLALKRTPGLDDFEAEDRFTAWCIGFGISVDDFYNELAHILKRRRDSETRT